MRRESSLPIQAAVVESNVRRRIVDGVLWLTILKLVGQVISWTITVYVVRILSPNDYGLMAMTGVYLNFVILFNELGLGTVLIQQKDVTREDISNIFWAVLLMNGTLYFISFLAAPHIAAFYNEPRLLTIVRVASLILIVKSVGLVSYHMLTRSMVFNKRSQAEMAGNLAGAACILWLATHGYGVWSLVYGNIIIEVIKTLLFLFFYPWIPAFSFSFFKIRDKMHFGSMVVLARFFWYLASNVDFLIAGKILGKTQLGYYAIASQFAAIPLDKMVFAITQVALPAFSRLQEDQGSVRRYFLRIVGFLAFVSFPAFWGIFLVADKAVPFFLSETWSPAILPLQILCIVSAFRAIETMNAPLVIAAGNPSITVLNNAIMGIALAISFFIGASYGLRGLAYSWLLFPIVSAITTSISLRVIGLSLSEYFKQLRHPFFGTLSMVIVVSLGQKVFFGTLDPFGSMAASVIFGLGSYLLYYVLFDRETLVEDKRLVRS